MIHKAREGEGPMMKLSTERMDVPAQYVDQVAGLSTTLMLRLRPMLRAAESLGWAFTAIEHDDSNGRLCIQAKSLDGERLVTLARGCYSNPAILMREYRHMRRGGRVGSGGWRPDVMSWRLLGRTEGHPADLLKGLLHYIQDNARKALAAPGEASLLPCDSQGLRGRGVEG